MEIPEALKNMSEKDRERLEEFDRETKALIRKHEKSSPNNEYTAPQVTPKSCLNCKHENDCYDDVMAHCGDDDMKYWQEV